MPRARGSEIEEETATEHWSTDNWILTAKPFMFWKIWYVYSFCQTLLRNLQLSEVQLKEVTNKKIAAHQNSQFSEQKQEF